jgi:1,4-alpha-glucan branching enzyme
VVKAWGQEFEMSRSVRFVWCAAAASLSLAAVCSGQGANGDVEWDGVSHIDWYDRSPQCPVDGEAFTVRFQAYRGDLTSARVIIFDGGQSAVGAVRGSQRGPYDIWTAELPATASSSFGYVIELTDSPDTDYFSAVGMTEDLGSAVPFEIDFTTLSHAPVGATPATGGAVFKVWAPGATSAQVRGEFNGWGTTTMTRSGEHYTVFVPGAQVGQQYKYFFNGSTWKPDARAKRLNPLDNYNSVIVDRESYPWQVNDFSPVALEDMVIYQLHVGSFAGRNDPFGPAANPSGFRDVGERAAHLAELGVNAVMVNPICEFPGDFSGGYNPISAWAVESKYGTPDDLKYMIDQLHASGIAVLLDIVWNHFANNENYLWQYDTTQIYFDTPAVSTPWGSQADFDRGPVRSYFLDSAVLMLDEYRFDGFRMDATDFMNIGPQEPAGWSLMQALNNLVDRRYVDKHVIAEQLPDDPWVTKPVQFGGAGFDSQYYDHFTDTLREQILVQAPFGDPDMFALRDRINGGGIDLSNEKVTNYFELHDEAWPLSGGQRAVRTIDTTPPHDDVFARTRTMLAQGLVMTVPGVPAFLMGTEWLEDAPFEEEKIDWSHKTQYSEVFAYYRDLVRLRAQGGPLSANAFHQVHHVNDSADILAFWRRAQSGADTRVIVNFGDQDWGIYRIGLPEPGRWVEVINSQSSEYGGSGFVSGDVDSEPVGLNGFPQSGEFRIARASISIFQLDSCYADCDGSGLLDVFDFLCFQDAFVQGDPYADCDGSGALDVFDFLCFQDAFVLGCP